MNSWTVCEDCYDSLTYAAAQRSPMLCDSCFKADAAARAAR